MGPWLVVLDGYDMELLGAINLSEVADLTTTVGLMVPPGVRSTFAFHSAGPD